MWTIVGRSEETMTDQTQTPQPWKDTKVVGRAMPRIDAYERVSGSAVYPTDVVLPDMLYAAVLRCPHAHARVGRVDTSQAEKMPGVRAVITDATPEARIGWYQGREKPLSRLFDPDCRYAGEEVAALAAETPYQAWDAARAIKVDYEVLPFVVTEEDALKPGALPCGGGIVWGRAGNRARQPGRLRGCGARVRHADAVRDPRDDRATGRSPGGTATG
jgi:xanthine dehydrogenase YagR molybdenum-binding subunit